MLLCLVAIVSWLGTSLLESLNLFFVFNFSLQCPFIDVTVEDIDPNLRFNANLVADGLRQLILSIHHRAGFINVYQSVMDGSEPDIRYIVV